MASTGSHWAIYVYVCMNVCTCVFKSLKTKYNLWLMGGQPHTLAHRPDSQNLHALAQTYTLLRKMLLWAMCIDQLYIPRVSVYVYSIYISNEFSLSYNTQQLELSTHKYILGKGRKKKITQLLSGNSSTFSCYVLFKATCHKSDCSSTLHISWNILLNQILNLFIFGSSGWQSNFSLCYKSQIWIG